MLTQVVNGKVLLMLKIRSSIYFACYTVLVRYLTTNLHMYICICYVSIHEQLLLSAILKMLIKRYLIFHLCC